jgi:hypothetical protein
MRIACAILTRFVTAVRATEFHKPIASLAGERFTILAAFDMLLTGV